MRRALKVVLDEADPRTREVFTRVALEEGDPAQVAADFGLTANSADVFALGKFAQVLLPEAVAASDP